MSRCVPHSTGQWQPLTVFLLSLTHHHDNHSLYLCCPWPVTMTTAQCSHWPVTMTTAHCIPTLTDLSPLQPLTVYLLSMTHHHDNHSLYLYSHWPITMTTAHCISALTGPSPWQPLTVFLLSLTCHHNNRSLYLCSRWPVTMTTFYLYLYCSLTPITMTTTYCISTVPLTHHHDNC